MVSIESVTEIARAVQIGERTAEDVVSECLARIDQHDRQIHAFLSCERERSSAKALEIDAARARGEALGPLAGVPLAVKDNICTSFGKTTCGSKMLEPFRAQYDAFAVERLESAGAIILGKANLDEFAMGSSTEHGAFGITRNPWNERHVAGGSSGGPAAAVAARMVPAALGSDTGGSVRQPASFCGVAGLKPTYGRVSRFGLVAFGSSLDQIGPIARSVEDIALLLGTIAGFDRRDSTCVNAPVPDYTAALERPLQGVRIGLCEELFGEGLSEEVRVATRSAIDLMCGEGARIVPIQLPHVQYGIACYYLIATAEASSNLARFDGVHFGRRTRNATDVEELYAASRAEGFGPEVKRRIMLGTFVLSSGYYDAYYVKALKVRTLIKQDFDRAFNKVDVIASPVAPTTAFKIGERSEDPLAMYLEDLYTITANLAGICAISVPCGYDSLGLPIGLQLLGPPFGEETLLAAAHQYQQRTDHHRKQPPVASSDGDES